MKTMILTVHFHTTAKGYLHTVYQCSYMMLTDTSQPFRDLNKPFAASTAPLRDVQLR